MGFALTPDQRTAVENTGGPLLVSAAAGAGKTRVLVERLLDRVAAGADVDRFLVITFTKAAAGELRERVLEELNTRLGECPGDRHLRRQTTLVYQANISTVDAFCGDFLRQWGHLLDLDPDCRLCEEGEAEVLRREAAAELMDRRYEAPDESLGLLLETFSGARDDRGLVEMVLEIHGKLQSHPDPQRWLEEQKAAFQVEGLTDAAQTPWGGYLLGRYRRLAWYWYDQLSRCLEECRAGVPMYVESLTETLEGLRALGEAASWETARAPEFPRLKPCGKDADRELAEQVKGMRERCKTRFARIGERLDIPSASILRDLGDTAPVAGGLLDLVGDFSRTYQELKRRRSVMDFSDLEHLTLQILREHPQVTREWADKFDEVMVDEYQDTNQVQNAIFDALTGEKGNLFMVGDVKQSIYRFRLAEPGIFLEKYRTYPLAAASEPGEGRRVNLGENFRSRPEIIDCVNFLFEALMSREMGELDYGEEERLTAAGEREPREDCGPELHLIFNPAADETGDRSMVEPRFIAKRLRELLDSGFPITEKGERRPVRPSDMVILLRAPNRVLGRYARALREQDIPWVSEGGEDFFDAPETAVALSYLEIIDNPRQDVPLIAVLRSPLYGFTPDRLADLRGKKGEGCYYDALLQDQGEDSRRMLEDLTALRLTAQDKRSCELLWELYCRTGMLALYANLPGGESRREHLLGLYSYARQFENSGHKGLFGFLTHLRRRREQGETLTLPKGEAAGGVRILSIHRSKGLEFPVVAVAGLGKQFNRQDTYAPMLFHRDLGLGPNGLDRERRIRYPTVARWAVSAKLDEEMRGEELRLLYVALTRAREKLILTAAMKAPERETGRLLEETALPVPPELVAAQPTAAHWVLAAALCRREAEPIRFGRLPAHVPPAGTRWGGRWEITLENGEGLDRPPHRAGQVTDPAAEEAGDGPVPDYSWRYPWAEAETVPSKLTATQLKGRELDREAEEDAAPPPRPVIFDRPSFAREGRALTPGERGTAHHMVMQFLDFSKATDLEGIAGEIRRMVDREIITPQQGETVDPGVILAFFRSDLGRAVTEAGEGLRREFKFSILQPAEKYYPQLPPGETVLLQGVVDCWFDTPQGLVIVDFKSDHVKGEDLTARAEEYRPQLDTYGDALSALLDRPVARRVLWFFSESRAVEL